MGVFDKEDRMKISRPVFMVMLSFVLVLSVLFVSCDESGSGKNIVDPDITKCYQDADCESGMGCSDGVCISDSDIDRDNDGIPDVDDNCPAKVNTPQADSDSDGVGDACDNCISVSNPEQESSDTEGVGLACSVDTDEDSIYDSEDNCISVSNYDQADADGDGKGDECDFGEVDILLVNTGSGGKLAVRASGRGMVVKKTADSHWQPISSRRWLSSAYATFAGDELFVINADWPIRLVVFKMNEGNGAYEPTDDNAVLGELIESSENSPSNCGGVKALDRVPLADNMMLATPNGDIYMSVFSQTGYSLYHHMKSADEWFAETCWMGKIPSSDDKFMDVYVSSMANDGNDVIFGQMQGYVRRSLCSSEDCSKFVDDPLNVKKLSENVNIPALGFSGENVFAISMSYPASLGSDAACEDREYYGDFENKPRKSIALHKYSKSCNAPGCDWKQVGAEYPIDSVTSDECGTFTVAKIDGNLGRAYVGTNVGKVAMKTDVSSGQPGAWKTVGGMSADAYVKHLAVADDGSVYAGTTKGLFKLCPNSQSFGAYDAVCE